MPPLLLQDIREALKHSIYEQKTRLSPAQLDALKAHATSRSYKAFDRVFGFGPGERADTLYVVVSGSVLNYELMPDKRIMVFDRTGPRGFFGEVASFYDGSRSAIASALEPTELLEVRITDPATFVREHPDLAHLIIKGMAERLSRSGRDFGNAPLRGRNLKPIPTAADNLILDTARLLASGWFLLLFAVTLCVWAWFHHSRNLDPGTIGIALTLSIVQIVIGNLVLNSQLRADDLEAVVETEVRDASLKAEAGIATVRAEQQQLRTELLQTLEEIRKRP